MRSEYSANYHMAQPLRKAGTNTRRVDSGITVFTLIALLVLMPVLAAVFHYAGDAIGWLVVAVVLMVALAKIKDPS